MSEWNPTRIGLPAKGTICWVTVENISGPKWRRIMVMFLFRDGWHCLHGDSALIDPSLRVTAWIPMPSDPYEEIES